MPAERNSSPVMAVASPSRRPTSSAIATAVPAWSPVTITSSIPADLASPTTLAAVSRTGSRSPSNARNVNDRASPRSAGADSSSRRAIASIRMPRPARSAVTASSSVREASSSATEPPVGVTASVQISITASGAPLTSARTPAPDAYSVSMRRRAESNGTAASRGRVSRAAFTRSGPRASSSARSTGSPLGGSRVASLQRASASARRAAGTAGRSSNGTGGAPASARAESSRWF